MICRYQYVVYDSIGDISGEFCSLTPAKARARSYSRIDYDKTGHQHAHKVYKRQGSFETHVFTASWPGDEWPARKRR